MNKSLPVLLFLFTFLNISAQINFEKGYFIRNGGTRTECLIRNVDWKNNPTGFDYKSSETSKIQTNSISNVQEFGINGESKFVRYQVKINTSSDVPERLDLDRAVKFEDQTLFLKELVHGDATLYYYENGNLRRFFYSIGTIEAEQLVYKRFFYSPEAIEAEKQNNKLSNKTSNSIGKNAMYRQQLLNGLKCEKVSIDAIKRIRYTIDDLVELFEKYNQCSDPNWVQEKRDANKLGFNFSLRPGINLSSLNISDDGGVTAFESNTSLRFGVELEFVLPFNKNKWSLIFEPTYRNYQSTKIVTFRFRPDPKELDVDYLSIEFSAGVRYYAFLNNNSKLFISGYMLNDMELNSSVSSPTFVSSRLKINPLSNFAFGLGYKLKDKFSLEFRYDFDRGIIRTIPYASEFKNVSLILGYTIL